MCDCGFVGLFGGLFVGLRLVSPSRHRELSEELAAQSAFNTY